MSTDVLVAMTYFCEQHSLSALPLLATYLLLGCPALKSRLLQLLLDMKAAEELLKMYVICCCNPCTIATAKGQLHV